MSSAVTVLGKREELPADLNEIVGMFSYGANLSHESLTNRGVCVVKSERAILKDYRLVFNKVSQSGLESGTYANVEPQEGSEVHGALHLMTVADVQKLDKVEGPGYGRLQLKVHTYDNEEVIAHTYLQTESYPVSPLIEGSPGERYIKLIIFGAKQTKLAPEWIEKLQSIKYVPFTKLVWTQSQLNDLKREVTELTPTMSLMNGVVLDLASLDPFAHRLLSGDKTAFVIGLVSYDPKPSRLEDASPDQLAAIESIIQNLIMKGAVVVGNMGNCPYLNLNPTPSL
jgi:gamma-glutamylcyclotransferase (GGCT)/AIG2-like uncharacterized protein YtfP